MHNSFIEHSHKTSLPQACLRYRLNLISTANKLGIWPLLLEYMPTTGSTALMWTRLLTR